MLKPMLMWITCKVQLNADLAIIMNADRSLSHFRLPLSAEMLLHSYAWYFDLEVTTCASFLIISKLFHILYFDLEGDWMNEAYQLKL